MIKQEYQKVVSGVTIYSLPEDIEERIRNSFGSNRLGHTTFLTAEEISAFARPIEDLAYNLDFYVEGQRVTTRKVSDGYIDTRMPMSLMGNRHTHEVAQTEFFGKTSQFASLVRLVLDGVNETDLTGAHIQAKVPLFYGLSRSGILTSNPKEYFHFIPRLPKSEEKTTLITIGSAKHKRK